MGVLQPETQRKNGLQPEILRTMTHIEGTFRSILKNPHYVVDFNPGPDWHFSGSHAAPHGTGFAIDIGLNLPNAPIDRIKDAIAQGLGSKFRVLLENGGRRRFLHVEFAARPSDR